MGLDSRIYVHLLLSIKNPVGWIVTLLMNVLPKKLLECVLDWLHDMR